MNADKNQLFDGRIGKSRDISLDFSSACAIIETMRDKGGKLEKGSRMKYLHNYARVISLNREGAQLAAPSVPHDLWADN